jgi:hypothetical protein
MADEVVDASEREQRVNRLLAEYLEAERLGRAPDRDELLRRHPELARELQSFFADKDQFGQLAGLLGAATPSPADTPTLAPAASAESVVGTKVRYVGDYELLEEIARGGMGVVYKARQISLQRLVALKMILAGQLASADDVRRFHTEAENAARLDHPTGKEVRALKGHTDRVVSGFSPDGRRILTASWDGTALQWEAATGRQLSVMKNPHFSLRSAAFSPDGRQVLHFPSRSYALAARGKSHWADGRLVLSAARDRAAVLQEVDGGKEAVVLRGHDAATTSAGFSPSGHQGPIYHAVFSPDGERLATTSGDGTARVWPLDPLPLARARRPRDLTPPERQRYAIEAAAAAPSATASDGGWRQDLADYFARDVQDKPADVAALSRAALARLAAGDRAGYGRLGTAICDAFLRSGDANEVNHAAWACALGPDALADYGPLLRALEKAIGPKPDANQLNTLGALLYRAGRYEEAVKRLEEAIARRDKVGTVHDWLFLALAHQRLGHADEARKWLDRAVRALGKDTGGSWEQRLELRLLRQEAEEIVPK